MHSAPCGLDFGMQGSLLGGSQQGVWGIPLLPGDQGIAVRTIQTFVEAFAKLRLSLQAPILRCHARRPSARVMLICSRRIASTDCAARLDPSYSHSRTRRGVSGFVGTADHRKRRFDLEFIF